MDTSERALTPVDVLGMVVMYCFFHGLLKPIFNPPFEKLKGRQMTERDFVAMLREFLETGKVEMQQ
jgi:hypothetical protein